MASRLITALEPLGTSPHLAAISIYVLQWPTAFISLETAVV